MHIQAKKSLGQNFLLNPTTLDKILDHAKVGSEDYVLEVGPGTGAMTTRIAMRESHLVAVEKDHRMIPVLQEKLVSFPKVQILEADFLEVDLPELLKASSSWKVVANLPYYVATQILFHLLERRELFSSLWLMVQKEVALRLTASPGTKAYGGLSVMAQYYSTPKMVMKLPPGAFSPRPQVDSAIVGFQVKKGPLPTDPTQLRKIVQAAFQQRRKMVLNSLRENLPFPQEKIRAALEGAGINPQARAEEVPLEGFVKITQTLTEG